MEQLQWSELNTIRYYQYLNNIINDRGQWNIPKGEYKEGHHIILQCFGGTGNTRSKDPNIIWLYPSEHYIAHKILAEDNDDYSIKMAFSMMAFPKGTTKREPLSAEEYEEARVITCGGHRVLTEEHLAHIRDKMREIKESGVRKGIKKTEEHKQKIKESNLGKKHNISPEGLEGIRNSSRVYWNSLTPQEDQEQRRKLSELHKGMHWYTDENGHQFRSKDMINDPKIKNKRIKTWNSFSGWKWANNGTSNIQVLQGDELPDGYAWGCLHTDPPTIRITNGTENKTILDTEEIPEGWHIGLTVAYNYRDSKVLVNNGEIAIYIDKTEPLPEGYTYGRIPRMCITDGVKNKRIKLTESIPQGWWKGRTTK